MVFGVHVRLGHMKIQNLNRRHALSQLLAAHH